MNRVFFLITFFVLHGVVLQAQTYQVTINNGYGSGLYNAGDTIDIWSLACDTTQTFDYWTGDTSFLEESHEWHTTLIVPAHNINFTAHLRNMPSYAIHHEKIRGMSNLKNVYYYFPADMKGVIYLFHGTGGNAAGWIEKTEGRSFTDAAIADSFGIIATEAEEITLNSDLNSDGKLRWFTYPLDSVGNVDYVNIKAITDTFVSRGFMDNTTQRYSLGMSNGGAYSTVISFLYHYKAGISYCASGTDTIFALTQVPFAFRMALFDDNAEVGPTGNHEAWQHDSTLQIRGICHDYLIHNRQHIYPERFARIPGISLALSQNIFNELLTNNQINAAHYAISTTLILANVQANPSDYPVIVSLSGGKKLEVLNQVASANAEHNFFSDYNYATLQFFNNLCSIVTGIEEGARFPEMILYPNPAHATLYVETPGKKPDCIISVIDLQGRHIFSQTMHSIKTEIDVSHFAKGMYFVKLSHESETLVRKFIKE